MMSNMRTAAVLALGLLLGACDRASRDVVAPSPGAPSFNAASDGGFGLSLEGPFDQVIATEDPSAQQAATGGRATGHVAFNTPFIGIATEKYSFVALGTDPPPPFAAKGHLQLQLLTTGGSDQKIHSEVICLSVVGNMARIGARITKAWVNNEPFPTTLFTLWTVTDVGEGQGTPDLASLVRFSNEASAQFHCAVGFVLEQLPIDEGNVQVSSR